MTDDNIISLNDRKKAAESLKGYQPGTGMLEATDESVPNAAEMLRILANSPDTDMIAGLAMVVTYKWTDEDGNVKKVVGAHVAQTDDNDVNLLTMAYLDIAKNYVMKNLDVDWDVS